MKDDQMDTSEGTSHLTCKTCNKQVEVIDEGQNNQHVEQFDSQESGGAQDILQLLLNQKC